MAGKIYHVFLSHSRNDPDATSDVFAQLRRQGLDVFKDDESIEPGDEWLVRLQSVLEGCGAFVVLVGRDGVRRWVGAEAQVALNRHFGPHDDARRLPIFPILLDGIAPETLPPLLRLFQVTRWTPGEALPADLLSNIRDRNIVLKAEPITGCPFVGLASYRPDQVHLFFGRRAETLDALACFRRQPTGPRVKWLEISGSSGSGKSSLMQAGLLPLIDRGWLWPRTGYEQWKIIGPMMPGTRPMEMLAESLGHAFGPKMAEVYNDLQAGDHALRFWLRDHKQDDTAFLLAIDQFEELFTFAEADERHRFDRLLAAALEDADCPLFVVSTVRVDFLDRFAEDLPRLVAVQNRLGRSWKLAPISAGGLREVIQGPADLADLDVSEIKELMVSEARDEPGALPLVENALHWLWQQRTGDRLSGRLFADHGGLAGILARGADDLLASLGEGRWDKALELLFRLVRVDREGIRHARQRLGLDEALKVAGGGEEGWVVVHCLSGKRRPDGSPGEGPLRLITVGEEGSVNLIHETLIRSKGLDAAGKPQPYWPTLWNYVEQHKERAAWRERLREDVGTWLAKGRSAGHQWSHERVREAADALRPMVAELSADERDFLGPMDTTDMLEELKAPGTTHKRRLLIGERLAVLDDPRRGVGVDADGIPEIDWCYVPGGDVTVSVLADPDRLYSKVADIYCKYCKQVETFYIARYPVTVAQYRAFLEAENGFCNPAWWGPDLYRDANGNEYEFGRFGNHPAIYMSWFDAVAFCRWLSGRLGFAVRLPDEWEWQQAASSGNDRNAFPWGANWSAVAEPWRANTLESRLGQATAVGMYLAGATPTGILDMAGTVWEWCLNKFETGGIEVVIRHGEYDRDPRVVRGGCWGSSRGSASSFDRGRHEPIVRNGYIGFRIVCSSPIFRD